MAATTYGQMTALYSIVSFHIPAPPSWVAASLFGYPAPKFGDPLEFCSAISLLVVTHHDSHKYAFKTFPFQHAAVVFLVVETRQMWRCSQTRCRSYLYSPTIVISFLDSSSFLNLWIRHFCLSNFTTECRKTVKHYVEFSFR